MSIRVTLDRILLERRMSLTDLSEKVGVTMANLSILKTGKAKAIRFSTLSALCRVLECQPGELLTYEPGDDEIEDSDRPSAGSERRANL
jgi:putative transcriptional regulator